MFLIMQSNINYSEWWREVLTLPSMFSLEIGGDACSWQELFTKNVQQFAEAFIDFEEHGVLWSDPAIPGTVITPR